MLESQNMYCKISNNESDVLQMILWKKIWKFSYESGNLVKKEKKLNFDCMIHEIAVI